MEQGCIVSRGLNIILKKNFPFWYQSPLIGNLKAQDLQQNDSIMFMLDLISKHYKCPCEEKRCKQTKIVKIHFAFPLKEVEKPSGHAPILN